MKGFIFFNSINHRMYNVEKCSNKIVIKICKPYKCLNVLNASWRLLILKGFDFFRIYMDTFNRDDQSWITDLGDIKFTFLNIYLQTCFF